MAAACSGNGDNAREEVSAPVQGPAPVAPPPIAGKGEIAVCGDNRPEACASVYQPVCAAVDSGVRCVTTPCPSSEWKTYSNSCKACADEKVSQYRSGACPG